MSPPILHPRTKAVLEAYQASPTHGLLLTGEAGSGKTHLAEWLANTENRNFLVIKKPQDKSTISIEQIRELYSLTRSGSNLTVIIKDSHAMGAEAQNAFLKLLEEPPTNVRFILTANSPQALLQTIRSRAQHITILKPSMDQLREYIKSNSSLNGAETEAILLTTSQRVGFLLEILQSEEALSRHLNAVMEAKKFYGSKHYERHIMCVSNGYDREWATDLLHFLGVIIQSLLHRQNESTTRISLLADQAKLIEETGYRLLKVNGNPKVHLSRLAEML